MNSLLNIGFRKSWSTYKIKEFDDDASAHYCETTYGACFTMEPYSASVVVKDGLEAFLNANIDGDGDESGCSGHHVSIITDHEGNILYEDETERDIMGARRKEMEERKRLEEVNNAELAFILSAAAIKKRTTDWDVVMREAREYGEGRRLDYLKECEGRIRDLMEVKDGDCGKQTGL